MATPELDRTNRRDQLGAFFDAVAGYVDVDGDASLAGLLAYLQAELDTGSGLEQAVPSDREAVKLLTVHRAKGLEWEVVFLPALMKGVFPSDRVTDNWLTNPGVLPADLRGDARLDPPAAGDQQRGRPVLQGGAEGPAAEGRGPAGLRRRDPRPAGADRHRPHLAGRARSGRGSAPPIWTAILAEAERQGEVRAEAATAGRGQPAGHRRRTGAVARAVRPGGLAAPQRGASAAVEAARRRRAETGSYEPPPGAGDRAAAGRPGDDRALGRRSGPAAGRARGGPLRAHRGAPAGHALGDGRCCDCSATRRGWRPRSPGRCPRRRPGRRGSAPGSTSGWSATSGPAMETGQLGQQQLLDPDDLPDSADVETARTRRDCASSAHAFLAGRVRQPRCRTPWRRPSRC